MTIRKDYEKLFKHLDRVSPPETLHARILLKINAEKQRSERTHLFIFGGFSLILFIALVPVFQYFMSEAHQSGTYQYLALLLSDGGSLVSYWKEFSLSLAESVPLLAILVLLSTLFLFLGSLKLALQNIKYNTYQLN